MKYYPASLALGGGGLKGVAHIGILQVFEEEGFPIEYIAGSSSGALLGALYAVGYSTKEILQIAKEYAEKPPLDFRIRPWVALIIFVQSILNWLKICDQPTKKGLVDGKQLDRYLAGLFGEIGFEDLRYPLLVPAVDLRSGRSQVFTSEKLARELVKIHDIDCCTGVSIATALRASVAIPGIIPPIAHNQTILVDGGVKDKVPADLLRFAGAERVIAVDVGVSTEEEQEFDTMLEILLQTVEVMGDEVTDLIVERYADLLIQPPLKKIALTDHQRIQEIYEIGYQTGKRKIPAIRSLLKR